MSGRIYTVEFDGATITATQDLFEIAPADDKPCEILGLFLGQQSDEGDAQAELLGIEIIRVPATFTTGSGGSSPTPRKLKSTDAAAGFTGKANNTTIATTSGTLEELHADAWNLQAGYPLWLPDGLEPDVVQGAGLVVRLIEAPVDSITAHGTLYVREFG